MRKSIAIFAIFIILLLQTNQGSAKSDHIEYNIKIIKDGSAEWTIIHATDIDSPIESWEEYEQRLQLIINRAKDNTGRDMTLDFTTLEMTTQINWDTSSKTITYFFRWQNFSKIKENQISFGDIFSENVFSFLYGDGELYLNYPPTHFLSTTSPQPNQINESTQTLHWYRTQDFLVGAQNVLFETKNETSNSFFNPINSAILFSSLLGITLITFFVLIQRNKRKEKPSTLDTVPLWQNAESDQDKILKLVESSGGKIKQSEVCDKLGFSRAKTSLLLSEMEKNSLIKRYKKGKSKIVFQKEIKEDQEF